MKTIQEILDNYKNYETSLDDRFGIRFAQFLSEEQMKQIGFSLKDGTKHYQKEWNRENILKQLKEDVEFGWEKAINQRGISSNLMYEVVRSWNKILEEGLENFDEYPQYGKPLFKETAKKYGWKLED